ncbi:hypothetical protein FF2_033222 [Malus domestica]
MMTILQQLAAAQARSHPQRLQAAKEQCQCRRPPRHPPLSLPHFSPSRSSTDESRQYHPPTRSLLEMGFRLMGFVKRSYSSDGLRCFVGEILWNVEIDGLASIGVSRGDFGAEVKGAELALSDDPPQRVEDSEFLGTSTLTFSLQKS